MTLTSFHSARCRRGRTAPGWTGLDCQSSILTEPCPQLVFTSVSNGTSLGPAFGDADGQLSQSHEGTAANPTPAVASSVLQAR